MKCSICKYNDIGEYGNNAEPINSGRCCDWCNNEFVIPKRLENIRESESCPTCGYYEDDIAWHYEDCPELKENKEESKDVR
jgi:hypothetical protein